MSQGNDSEHATTPQQESVQTPRIVEPETQMSMDEGVSASYFKTFLDRTKSSERDDETDSTTTESSTRAIAGSVVPSGPASPVSEPSEDPMASQWQNFSRSVDGMQDVEFEEDGPGSPSRGDGMPTEPAINLSPRLYPVGTRNGMESVDAEMEGDREDEASVATGDKSEDDDYPSNEETEEMDKSGNPIKRMARRAKEGVKSMREKIKPS
ncbi:hypothetical protein FB45DRAFT_920388 [Roridomyces roridus]|uniref:Uncharacterized protein n=1 Tax=Roridomyces roridus TaxID=1738132 RepID=A0AAD7BQ26_9AGAR|nr:hypothetical protein FB45DRAFT_920388 [Roridomyces roridus]